MNIKDFDKIFAGSYFWMKDNSNKKYVYNLSQNGNDSWSADVKLNGDHHVTLKIDKDGEISDVKCTCEESKYEYCRHSGLMLLEISNVLENKSAVNGLYGYGIVSDKVSGEKIFVNPNAKSSLRLKHLIDDYRKLSKQEAVIDLPADRKVHIEPRLERMYKRFYIKMKIGVDRMYVVSSVNDLLLNFAYNKHKKYGVKFEYDHNYNALDEKSLKLIKLCESIKSDNSRYYYYGEDTYYIDDEYLLKFLEIYKNEKVTIDKDDYTVSFEKVNINLDLSFDSKGRYQLAHSKENEYIKVPKGFIYMKNGEKKICVSMLSEDNKIGPLMRTLKDENPLLISMNDMPSFYTSVIKSIGDGVNIRGLEIISDDCIPPEAEISMYVDCDDFGKVIAAVKYTYGGNDYFNDYNQSENPFCDYAAEFTARETVRRYFKKKDDDTETDKPYYVIKEEDVYLLLSEGLAQISKIMSVFASDSFDNINIRKSFKPRIGITTKNNLLELDIHAADYTNGEILEILTAYKKGKKYHRLKDGSFAVIDDSVKEFAEIKDGLNISDKELLKQNINIPFYRMLYLDSIQSDAEEVRFERSKEFKKSVKEYKTAIEDNETAQVPESLNGIMREYQEYGFRWLKTISDYGFGGILADDMGLGKTIQAIALMLDMKNSTGGKSLVVCPSSLTLNWESEIARFAPELKVCVISGVVSARDELIKNIDDYDVAVTSYQTLTRDISKYENIVFDLHFVDEAQYIKNHTTQMAKAVKGINSKKRFALTGTPVENTLAELWSIFDFIMPGYLFNYSYFSAKYEYPIVKNGDKDAVKSLQRIVSPFILRRLKKNVLKELPDKTETVLFAQMEGEQKKLYNASVTAIKKSIKNELDLPQGKIKVLAMLTRLRQICCAPSLIYDNFNDGSAKLELCMELVESCVNSGHKILLFSQFTSMLEIIEKKLDETGISHYTLTGQTKPGERIRLVNSFNEDSTNVFLISLKAGGTGLNLTGADIVIHYDPWWNVSAENQASDRAYRIGQKNNVQIYKLITKETIEERIRVLQKSKAELYDIAVNGEGNIMKMTAEDIIDILQ